MHFSDTSTTARNPHRSRCLKAGALLQPSPCTLRHGDLSDQGNSPGWTEKPATQDERRCRASYLHSYGGPFKADTLRSRRQKPAAAPHPARTLRPCTVPRGAARVENKITAKNQAIVMLRKGQAQRGFRASQPKPLFGARWTPGESAHKDLSGIETPGGRPLLCVSPCTKTAVTKQAKSARPRAPGLKHPVAAPSASRSSGPASAGC